MTSALPPANPGISAEAAGIAALLSPVGAGLAWAVLAYGYFDAEATRTESTLGSLGVFVSVALPALLGAGILLIPLGIGVFTRSVKTRLAAAWFEAVVCGLAAWVWFSNVVSDAAPGHERLLVLLASLALVVPLVVTTAATPRIRARA